MQMGRLPDHGADMMGCAEQTVSVTWWYMTDQLATWTGAFRGSDAVPPPVSRLAAPRSDCESRPTYSEPFAGLFPMAGLAEPTLGL